MVRGDVSEPPGEQGHADWQRIAVGCGAGMFVVMGLGRFSLTAMVPALIAEGGLSPVEAGNVGMANMAGFLLGSAISVGVMHRFQRLLVLRLAGYGCVVGLVLSSLPAGFLWLAAVRGLMGITTGIIMVLGLALIAETAPANRRPAAASRLFTGVGLGILASAVLVPALASTGLALTWLSLAAAGGVAVLVADWGWRGAGTTSGKRVEPGTQSARVWTGAMPALLLAHMLFSFGIVPHTLYWVDFIVRAEGLGLAAGGLHWSLVGIFAMVGPALAAGLALCVGTHAALVLTLLLLGVGVAAPVGWRIEPMLVLSSMIFGAQPGVSVLLAARARDLGHASTMPQIMRAMILANGAGAVAGGLLMPWLFARLGHHDGLFLWGGGALLVAALAALFPIRRFPKSGDPAR